MTLKWDESPYAWVVFARRADARSVIRNSRETQNSSELYYTVEMCAHQLLEKCVRSNLFSQRLSGAKEH